MKKKLYVITSLISNKDEDETTVNILDVVDSEQAAKDILESATQDAKEIYEENELEHQVFKNDTTSVVETETETIIIELHTVTKEVK